MNICRGLLLISSIIFFLASLSIIIGGYIVPLIQHYGYSLTNCAVLGVYINNQQLAPLTILPRTTSLKNNGQILRDNYIGSVKLGYDFPGVYFSKLIDVINGKPYTITEQFLKINFKVNGTAICYVYNVPNNYDIVLSMFTNNTSIAFTVICAVIGLVLLGLFIFLKIRKSKRNGYANIERVT